MASPTQWTWIWVDSGSWWWTGRPGMLRFMGSQRVRHDWATELNWLNVSKKNTQLCEKATKILHFAIYICVWRCVFFFILQLKQHSTMGRMQEQMWESSCFCLSESEKWVKVLVTQLCLTLCNPMDCSSLSIGFHRQEDWNGLPLPSLGDLPDPEISCITGRFFTVWVTREAQSHAQHGAWTHDPEIGTQFLLKLDIKEMCRN